MKDETLHPHIARPRPSKPPRLKLRQRMALLRAKTRKPMSRARWTSRRPGVGAKVKAPAKRTGQAVVKAKYMSPGRTAGYARYMVKDKAEGKAAENVSAYMQSHGGEGPSGRAELFTKAGQDVNLEAFTQASHQDPRVWTIILSPQYGNQLDMERYAQAFMQQMETDTGKQLDYLAVIHTNTPNHHAHILLRGRDLDGQEFRLDPEYLSHGLRNRAIELQDRTLALGVHQAKAETAGHTTDATLPRVEVLAPAKDVSRGRGMEW